MSNQEVIVGGWTAYHSLTEKDREVFKAAMQGFVGVNYQPQAVATQLVAGTNYRFKCLASVPPALVVWESVVEIFQPLNGTPHITGITRV